MSSSLTKVSGERFAAAQAAATWMSRQVDAQHEHLGHGNLAQGLAVQNFAADEEIYAEGDDAGMFYKVTSGVVRTCRFLSDGRRQIDAFYTAGDIFGLEGGAVYALTAKAVTECRVVPHRRRGLEHAAARDDGMAMTLFTVAMRSLERAREHSLLLGRGSATQKLAAFLLELTRHRPVDEMVELVMTRQDIADYLGLTIETVSRTLSQLERDGVIALATSRRIKLKNRAALRNFNS